MDRFESEYLQLKKEHERLEHREQTLRKESVRLKHEQWQSEHRLRELERQSQRVADELRRERARAKESEARLQARLAEASAAGAQMRSELAEKSAQLNGILSSLSWRLTSPLRLAFGKSGRIKRYALLVIRAFWWTLTFQLPRRYRIRRQKRLVGSSGLFNSAFYLQQNPDVARAHLDPLAHYLQIGGFEGRDPNPLFDSDWYLAQNPDAAEPRVNPLLHYVTQGWKAKRDPHPLFRLSYYLERNADVAQAGFEPLNHYLTSGGFEGRDPHPLFDSDWYLEQNPDVATSHGNPFAHYVQQGRSENRNPHPCFDLAFYLEKSPDLSNTDVEPIEHYLKSGGFEGRDPHPLFDSDWYLARNVDLSAAWKNPLVHYLEQGWREGCDPSPFFDTDWYLQQNKDVADTAINPLIHYLRIGWKQGRNPNPGFNAAWYVQENPDTATLGMSPLIHYVCHGMYEGRQSMPVISSNLPARRTRVVFISGESKTPGHRYRILHIAACLAPHFFESLVLDRADLPAKLFELDDASVVWIWRMPWLEIAEAVGRARMQGAKIILDIDDFGFRSELPKAITTSGVRSQNYMASEMPIPLRHTDHCTAPTIQLAREVRDFSKPTTIIPNGFNAEALRVAQTARCKRQPQTNEMIRIGYIGQSRIQRDLAIIARPLAATLKQFPQTRLVLCKRTIDLSEFPELGDLEDQIEWRDPIPLDQSLYEHARLDINLAPAEAGDRFGETKSELSFVEAALVGVPTIASPIRPFKDAIRQGKTGFFASDESEWRSLIRNLVLDSQLRERVGANACLEVLWFYGPERRSLLVAQLLNQLLSPHAIGSQLFAAAMRLEHWNPLPPLEVPEYDILYETPRQESSRVAVTIPLYNYAHFLTEALESVYNQSVEHIDLVIVDDRSTDDSVLVAKSWLKQNYARFNKTILAQNRKNSKLGATRNAAVSLAETEFYLPLDPDNSLMPDCLAKCLASLNDTGAAFAYPTLELIGNDPYHSRGRFEFNPALFQCGNYVDAMAMVRRACWIAAGGYSVLDPMGYEDYEFWCKLVERGFSGVRVPDVLARYRVHKNSMLKTITDLPDNKIRVVEDLNSRHPWLQLSVPSASSEFSLRTPIDVETSARFEAQGRRYASA